MDDRDEERRALRASLGFSHLGSGDTFTELARRGHGPDQPNSVSAPPAFSSPPRAAALDRIEEQLARLQASVDRIYERLDALEDESSDKRWRSIGRRRHPT